MYQVPIAHISNFIFENPGSHLMAILFGSGSLQRSKKLLQVLSGANLVRLIVSSFFILAFGRLALLIMISVFGHTLSTAVFGEFNFILSLASWLSVILSLPHSNILFMAKYASSDNREMSFGYVIFSLCLVLFLCVLAAGIVSILFGYLRGHFLDQSTSWIAALTVLLGFAYWLRTIMRGEGHLALALAPQEILLPLSATIIYLFLPATLQGAATAYGSAAILAIAASSVSAFLYFRSKFSSLRPHFDWEQWRLRIPHLTIGGLAEISMGQWDIVLIGTLLNMEQTAYYAAAARLSLFTAIGLRVVETATAPLMTHILNGTGRHRMKQLLTHATLVSASVGLIAALPMILFPHFFLHLIGSDLGQGAMALQILAIGQIFNVLTGPVSQVLYLGGHERAYANGLWLTNIGAAVGFMLFVPSYGIVGGAALKAISVVVLNLGFSVYAYRSYRQ
jgi:O-antigen/teichoic acid export membrane protein